MKTKINDLLLKMQIGENCIGETANHLFDLLVVGKPLFEFVEHWVVKHRISAENKDQAYEILRRIYDKHIVWEGGILNREVNVIVK